MVFHYFLMPKGCVFVFGKPFVLYFLVFLMDVWLHVTPPKPPPPPRPVRARQPEPVAAAAARLHAGAGSGLGDLQRQLLNADRDFNPEDYEMLLQLDERAPGPPSSQDELQVTMLLSQMPVSQLAATSAGTQCIICLEKMEAGNEVRTLPCMHFFHRVCIDKWISMPGAPAKCPIDHAEIDPARRQL